MNDTTDLARIFARSVEVILSGQSGTGAYVACPAYRVYQYSWLRDGSFIAESMSRAGRPGSATAFLDWCAGVITDRAARIDAVLAQPAAPLDDLLPARYRLDGTDARGPGEQWWNFQLDGYGMWLWAARLHATRHDIDPRRWAAAVTLTVRYLNRCWHLPCFDWWEEHSEHRHTSTLAAIHAGLAAALALDVLEAGVAEETAATMEQIKDRVLREAVYQGRLAKWLGGSDVDASLIACFTPFGIIPASDPIAHATLAVVESSIAHGGVHRYPGDTFYGGGEWPLLAALLGWHYARTGQVSKAWGQLRWVAAQAGPAGDLPEQVSGHLLHPARYPEWVDRWGPVARPLLWSHAAFLILATELDLDLATTG
jgi:GH15 family glucan-1,4-alpha-glucosidase